MGNSAKSTITVRRLVASDAPALAELFEALAGDAATVRFFHPHPLTASAAVALCASLANKRDRFFAADAGGVLAGYMMLRGWDEGYALPSFGCAVHPERRGQGLGQRLLAAAIDESRSAGAERLRLTVYKANALAVAWYRARGFLLEDKNEQELVGWLDLQAAGTAKSAGRRVLFPAKMHPGERAAA